MAKHPRPTHPRVKLPRDEQAEARDRQVAQRLREVALQQLEWAHERTQEAHDAGRRQEADEHACTTLTWWAQLTGGG